MDNKKWYKKFRYNCLVDNNNTTITDSYILFYWLSLNNE